MLPRLWDGRRDEAMPPGFAQMLPRRALHLAGPRSQAAPSPASQAAAAAHEPPPSPSQRRR